PEIVEAKAEIVEAKPEAVETETVEAKPVKEKKAVKKVTKKVTTKKSAPKDKKLARQVKKANRLSGKASAPMTKTETITTINKIPTSFIADEDRKAHQTSGRTAVTTDVISRSSAEATKP
ncbi:MAG: ribonuclease E, partial [Colwellia sp.]